MKLTKSKLKEMIREEIQNLNEGQKYTGAEFGKRLINWCDDYMDDRKLDSFEKKLISNFMDLAKGVIKGNSSRIKADQSHWENVLRTYASDAGLRAPQFIFYQLWESAVKEEIQKLNEVSLQDIAKEFKNFDWTFAMSDDVRLRNRGEANSTRIKKLVQFYLKDNPKDANKIVKLSRRIQGSDHPFNNNWWVQSGARR